MLRLFIDYATLYEFITMLSDADTITPFYACYGRYAAMPDSHAYYAIDARCC